MFYTGFLYAIDVLLYLDNHVDMVAMVTACNVRFHGDNPAGLVPNVHKTCKLCK